MPKQSPNTTNTLSVGRISVFTGVTSFIVAILAFIIVWINQESLFDLLISPIPKPSGIIYWSTFHYQFITGYIISFVLSIVEIKKKQLECKPSQVLKLFFIQSIIFFFFVILNMIIVLFCFAIIAVVINSAAIT